MSFFKEWEVILKDEGKRLEPGPFDYGWIVKGIRHCGEEFGLYISSKRPQKQFLSWFEKCLGLSCREVVVLANSGKDRRGPSWGDSSIHFLRRHAS